MSNKQLSLILAAIADPTRRKMVEMLAGGDCTVSQLAEPFKLSLPTVTRHVQILERAGLVTKKKAGQQRVCRLSPRGLEHVRGWLENLASAEPDDAVGAAPEAPQAPTPAPQQAARRASGRPAKPAPVPDDRGEAEQRSASVSDAPHHPKTTKPKTPKVAASLCFGTFASSLGVVGVAATTEGVRAVVVGDDDRQVAALLAEACGETPTHDLKAIKRDLKHVEDVVKKPSAPFAGKLDLRGTDFQKRVWEALKGIPVGQTRTYTELAEELGDPGAVRAVASACGANPVAVVVPCHRVIRGDGNLAGYRWGIERKRQLLEREGAIQSVQLNLLG